MKNLTEDQNQKMLFVLFRQAVYRSYYRFVLGTLLFGACVAIIWLICGVGFDPSGRQLTFTYVLASIPCLLALGCAAGAYCCIDEILKGEGEGYEIYCQETSLAFLRVFAAKMDR